MSFWDSYNAAASAASNGSNALGDALKQFKQRGINQEVGQKLAGNDYAGAAQIYAREGDLENLQRAQAAGDDRRKSVLLNAAGALMQVPVDQRQAAYASKIRPVLQQFGAPEELLTQIDGADKSDESLRAFAAALGGQVDTPKPIEVSAGASLYDPRSGQLIGTAPSKPRQPNWMDATDANGNLIKVDMNQYAPGPDGVARYVGPQVGGYEQAEGPGDGLAGVAQAAPDATVTSGYRDEDHNARVGGRPNSRHLTGEAVDLVPKPGESMASLYQRVSGVPGVRAINEGDHVHVQSIAPLAAPAGGPGGVRFGKPQAEKGAWRALSPEEVQAQGLDPRVRYQVGPQGQVQAIGGQQTTFSGEQLNAASLTYAALGGNDRMNALAERGIYKPQTATDTLFRTDKSGLLKVVARSEQDRQFVQAAKEFLAPILRKDSGAAVSDGELRNYMDVYIPAYEDSPTVLWQKAQARNTAMRRLYGSAAQAYDAQYGKPNQWKVLTDPRGQPKSQKGTTPAGGKFEVVNVRAK